jgi:predicted metalloendopeptidase
VTTTDYLENTLNIIKFWRVFYYNRLRDKIDPKSWLEHSDVSVVNAFYGGDANYIEFPAGILQGSILQNSISAEDFFDKLSVSNL